MPNQFDNPANIRAHYETHGQGDHRTDEGRDRRVRRGHGHDGHAHGRGQAAQGVQPEIRIVGVEPLLGHKIQGLKNMQESIVPKIFDRSFPDEILNVNDEDAFTTTRQLALRGRHFRGHEQRSRRVRGADHGEAHGPRHDRRDPARPRGPLSEHGALYLGLRQMSAVMGRQTRTNLKNLTDLTIQHLTLSENYILSAFFCVKAFWFLYST